MSYDKHKIDQAVLALLGAWSFEGGRVWKRLDFDVMERLHAHGMISNPHGRQESVYLTEEGLQRARELAERYFGS